MRNSLEEGARSVFHYAGTQSSIMDFEFGIFAMECMANTAVARHAKSPRQQTIQVDKPQEEPVQERQKREKGTELSAAALLPHATQSIWTALHAVPAVATASCTLASAPSHCTGRTELSQSCCAAQSLRGEVQRTSQCGHPGWCQCPNGASRLCSEPPGSSTTTGACYGGRSVWSSRGSPQSCQPSEARQVSDAQCLEEFPGGFSEEMAGIHPRIPTTGDWVEHQNQSHQGPLQNGYGPFRKAQSCQSGHRFRDPSGFRRRPHGNRGQGCEGQCSCYPPRDIEWDARDFRDPEDESPIYAGRRERRQEDEAFHRIIVFTLNAAFWQARCVGQQDTHLGLWTLAGEEWSSCPVQKWSHSTWEDPHSTTEWQAIWDASLLSFELDSFVPQESQCTVIPKQRLFKKRGIDVKFDPLIQVAIGMEDDISFSTTWCTHQQLQSWTSKPWGLDPTIQAKPLVRAHAGAHDEGTFHPSLALQDLFPQNRPRDLPHDAPPWMQRTFRFLFTETPFEYEDQQPEVVLQTWFLRETVHRICKRPRMIALNRDFFHWKRQLLRLWEDLVEPGTEAQFFLVKPDPMRTSLQSFHAHLIIVQNRRLEAPILATMLWHGHHHDFLLQNALFVPTDLHLEVLQHKLDITQQCQALRCTWWTGSRQINTDRLPRVQPGDGLQILLHDSAQPDRVSARFPTVEWPYVEPPPPQADPEDLFLHPDGYENNDLLLTQLRSSVWTDMSAIKSGFQQTAVTLFEDKENCDPVYGEQNTQTFSPTSNQPKQGEDVTQPPLRTALSSLTFAKAQNCLSPTTEQGPAGGDPIFMSSALRPGQTPTPFDQLRLTPEFDVPSIPDPQPEEHVALHRPPIWTFPTWIQELWMTLRRYGTVPREGEGPVIQIVTWYLHLRHQRRCYRPRLLQLDDMCETWDSAVRRLWHDHIDPRSPLAFFKVFPAPPRLPEQPIAHLILSQEQEDQKAVLITALWATQITNLYGITHVATYLPEQITAQAVIDHSDAAAQCSNRASLGISCQVSVARMPIEGDHQVPCEDGYGIQVTVPWQTPGVLPPPSESEATDDEVAFFAARVPPDAVHNRDNLNQQSTTSPTSTTLQVAWDATRPTSWTALSSPFNSMTSAAFDVYAATDVQNVDHDDIDDAVSYMATNLARETYDPHQKPLMEQPGITRNTNSADEDIPPEDMQELYDEEASMEQDQHQSDQEPPAREPRPAAVRYSSIIYMINSPPVQAQMAYGDRNEFYAQAAAMVQIPINQLVYLYKIPYPPEDLDQSRTIPMIAQITGELIPGSIHRYVLLDTEFHATLPTLAPEVDRSTRLLPKQLTRFQILRVCGLASYCIRARNNQAGCFIWINGRLIPEQDQSLQDLAHGDYVRIAVPPDIPTAESFSTREMAAICWVGAAPVAEMGEAGRAQLPQFLPNVPPDTATVYALPPVHYELDDASYMQVSASTPTVEAAHVCPHLEDASNMDIHEMPLFEQRLHSLRQGRQALRSGPTSNTDAVTTWYLDHQRIPHQPWGRVVYLDHNYQAWRQQILQEWNDVVLSDRPALFNLVHPSPRNDHAGTEVHIIVTQTPGIEKTSILLTTEFHQSAVGLRTRQALAHPRITNTRAIKEAADCDNLPVGHCAQVHHGFVLMDPQLAYDTQDGDHFWVYTITAREVPMSRTDTSSVSPTLSFDIENADSDDDGLHLLQAHVQRRHPIITQFQHQCFTLYRALEDLQQQLKTHVEQPRKPINTEDPTVTSLASQSKHTVVLSLQKHSCVPLALFKSKSSTICFLSSRIGFNCFSSHGRSHWDSSQNMLDSIRPPGKLSMKLRPLINHQAPSNSTSMGPQMEIKPDGRSLSSSMMDSTRACMEFLLAQFSFAQINRIGLVLTQAPTFQRN